MSTAQRIGAVSAPTGNSQRFQRIFSLLSAKNRAKKLVLNRFFS
jgi:hypothetical protein